MLIEKMECRKYLKHLCFWTFHDYSSLKLEWGVWFDVTSEIEVDQIIHIFEV